MVQKLLMAKTDETGRARAVRVSNLGVEVLGHPVIGGDNDASRMTKIRNATFSATAAGCRSSSRPS